MPKFKWLILFVFLFHGCLKNETPKVEPQIGDERAAKLSKTKESVAPFFKLMRVEKGDWLETFQERGQTFEEYITQNPTLPTAERRTIYIQPIGEFNESQRNILRLTAEYMKAFYNLPVKLNEEKSLQNVPKEMKRQNALEGQTQIKTGYFINDVLPKILPNDAAALICFTNYDLYPDENWNYVFGQATLQNRVGVYSLWRFGKPDKNEDEYRLVFTRTLKVAMHETGHMFSIHHCTKYECLMSGVNHLGETDRRPLDVCPECMAKIAWAMNYEPTERYRKLSEFWNRQGWTEESMSFTKKVEAVESLKIEIK
jgi:archaemetzincin